MALKADLMLRTELAWACNKLRYWAWPPSGPRTAECVSVPCNRLAFCWRGVRGLAAEIFNPLIFRVAKLEWPASPLGGLEHRIADVG
jgi:hypothetical protein